MKIEVLTLFPDFFDCIKKHSIIKRAIQNSILGIETVNIRDFASGTYKTVDDTPYGGGPGLVMKVDIIHKALSSIKPKPYTILLSATGKKFTQKTAKALSKKKNMALICGHYEGIDTRVEKYVDETLSIGDYILTGGEIPALVLIDSVTRFLPGSINPDSPKDESFENGLLEYPQYTKPESYLGEKVPQILLSGNHAEIAKWRKKESLKRTKKFRPDLVSG